MHLEGTTGYKPLPFLFKGATDGHLTPELTDPLFSQTKSKSLLRKDICLLYFETTKYETKFLLVLTFEGFTF